MLIFKKNSKIQNKTFLKIKKFSITIINFNEMIVWN